MGGWLIVDFKGFNWKNQGSRGVERLPFQRWKRPSWRIQQAFFLKKLGLQNKRTVRRRSPWVVTIAVFFSFSLMWLFIGVWRLCYLQETVYQDTDCTFSLQRVGVKASRDWSAKRPANIEEAKMIDFCCTQSIWVRNMINQAIYVWIPSLVTKMTDRYTPGISLWTSFRACWTDHFPTS